jgi:cell division initiation protein
MTQRQHEVRHESPVSIRNEVFSHRMRGLDEDEVRDYLETLADQVEETNELLYARSSELEELRRENEALRAENRRLREATEHASTDTNPRAAELLCRAQQVADQLVNEAVIHARDLLVSARHQQRDMLQRTHDAAEEALRRTGAPLVQSLPTEYSTPIPAVEHVSTFARAAQVQLRSVLEALTEQVERLGEVPQLERGGAPVEQPAVRLARDVLDGPGLGGAGDASEVRARIYEQLWSMRGRAIE